jgi:phosphoadenosine phosphosulfate reductase
MSAKVSSSDIAKLNEEFESAQPQKIVDWAIKTFAPRIGLSSSFGGQSAALIHLAIQVEPKIPIVFINTGFLFNETLQFVEDLKKRFNLNIREFKATPEQIAVTKENLAKRKSFSEPCCDDSKIALMKKSLEGFDCWLAGLRRSQGDTRKSIKIIEEYEGGLLKVHPLANWSSKQLYAYMTEHHLPFHPLWEKGFSSIGCEPCTQRPLSSEDERSGRWVGSEKKECGIHTFLEKKN